LLLPLVGFDETGNRLGMGGGYYDRTLSYLRQRKHWRRPRLVGIAHECQKVDALAPSPWDVPLDMIVTEERVYVTEGIGSRE
jgi:5-formyltetrahydrofolate cyclo-ligase